MALLSVIIPAYNTEAYIRQAIESLLANDIAELEIIFVDDCSSDKTAKVAAKVLGSVPGAKVIVGKKHKPGGAAAPSNLGLEHATGKYIGFLDSDDWVGPDYFADLLQCIQSGDFDIVIGGYRNIEEFNHVERPQYDIDIWKDIIASGKTTLPKDVALSLSPEPWRKLYRTDWLRAQGLKFPVLGWFNEDYPFHWIAVPSAGKIGWVNNRGYFHRLMRPGQTTEVLDERLFHVFDHTRFVIDFLRQRNLYEQNREQLYRWLMRSLWRLKAITGSWRDDYCQKYCALIAEVYKDGFTLPAKASRKAWICQRALRTKGAKGLLEQGTSSQRGKWLVRQAVPVHERLRAKSTRWLARNA